MTPAYSSFFSMATPKTSMFDPAGFLAEAGVGRKIVEFRNKQTVFSQGDLADSVFYIQKGQSQTQRAFGARQRGDVGVTQPR